MQSGTMHRLYIGGRYGSNHERAGELIYNFESDVERLAARHLMGGTVLLGTGLWEGQDEPCAIVETLIDNGVDKEREEAKVLTLAEALKVRFTQDAIMHTTTEIGFSFV